MMLENNAVLPRADDDAEMVTMPDGLTVINEIPNETANQLLLDWAYEDAPNGKMWIQNWFDLALQTSAHREDWLEGCDESYGDYQAGCRKVLLSIIECATRAGESDYAQDVWLEGQK